MTRVYRDDEISRCGVGLRRHQDRDITEEEFLLFSYQTWLNGGGYLVYEVGIIANQAPTPPDARLRSALCILRVLACLLAVLHRQLECPRTISAAGSRHSVRADGLSMVVRAHRPGAVGCCSHSVSSPPGGSNGKRSRNQRGQGMEIPSLPLILGASCRRHGGDVRARQRLRLSMRWMSQRHPPLPLLVTMKARRSAAGLHSRRGMWCQAA